MNINDSFRFLNYGLPEDILRYKLAGDFASAIRLIDYRLKDSGLPAGMKGALEVQKIICHLLPGEFPYTRKLWKLSERIFRILPWQSCGN